MFNWVVKVVPQLPEAPGTEEAAPSLKSKEVKGSSLNKDEVSEDSLAQTGVIGWLSNGFASTLPQPAHSPLLSRANSETRGEDGERSGVIGWVKDGLTKVLPQPDEKYRESEQPKTNPDECTEIYEVETMADFDPLPHIPVVEIESEDEESVVEYTQFASSNSMMNWIKQMVPQPAILPPGAVPTEPSNKSARSSVDKILSPPPESLSGISLESNSKTSGMVGWFVTGLGLKMPQPVTQPKDDATGAAEILQKGGKALRAP